MLHTKALSLLRRQSDLVYVATDYYTRQGRGAILVKFRDAEELMQPGVHVMLLYIPLEQSLLLNDAELARQLHAYDPLTEYVLLVTVSTECVPGGELMQAITARMNGGAGEAVMVQKPGSTEIELVGHRPPPHVTARPPHGVCAYCYAARPEFRCARCAHSFYCSKLCQQRHWKQAHKRTCRA